MLVEFGLDAFEPAVSFMSEDVDAVEQHIEVLGGLQSPAAKFPLSGCQSLLFVFRLLLHGIFYYILISSLE